MVDGELSVDENNVPIPKCVRCGSLPRIRHNGRTRGVCGPCEAAQARERTARRRAKHEEMVARVRRLELEIATLRGVIQELRLRR